MRNEMCSVLYQSHAPRMARILSTANAFTVQLTRQTLIAVACTSRRLTSGLIRTWNSGCRINMRWTNVILCNDVKHSFLQLQYDCNAFTISNVWST
jgi:hypothetical protein